MKYFLQHRFNFLDTMAISLAITFIARGDWWTAGIVYFLFIALSVTLETKYN